jgi:hypothetical protein
VQVQPLIFLVLYCILVAAEQVAHITVADTVMEALAVEVAELFTMQVHILIDLVPATKAMVEAKV